MFEHILKNSLTTYHAQNLRYRHLGFSSKSLATLDKTLQTLLQLLPDYRVWNGENPDATAPALLISRKKFIDLTFEDSPQGLIIFQPQSWLNRWQILDKQAFWSALSSHHGGHNVIVLFIESPDFAKVNHRYFYPESLTGTPLTAWISTKTKLS